MVMTDAPFYFDQNKKNKEQYVFCPFLPRQEPQTQSLKESI